MYKGTSQSLQTKHRIVAAADAIGASGYGERQTKAESRAALSKALNELDHKIASLPKGSKARAVFIKQKIQLQQEVMQRRALGYEDAGRPYKIDQIRLASIFKHQCELQFGVEETQTVWQRAQDMYANEPVLGQKKIEGLQP